MVQRIEHDGFSFIGEKDLADYEEYRRALSLADNERLIMITLARLLLISADRDSAITRAIMRTLGDRVDQGLEGR
jgi:hypothetical protein